MSIKGGVMSDLILNSKKQPEQPNTARLMHSHRIQQGLSLIEISVVTVIVLLLAVLAVPAIQGYLVENRVPKVGEALAHYVLRQHLNASVHGAGQYEGMNIDHFSRQNQDKAVFNIQGQGGQVVVHHGLGKDGELLINEIGRASCRER